MPLSCSCDYEPEPGQILYYRPNDFDRLDTNRRKRCESCSELIDIGEFVLRFGVVKIPESEMEERAYGEDGEIPRADVYLCEKCGEIYLNLQEVGFSCILPTESMNELLRQYQEDYSPPIMKSVSNY